MQWNGMDVVYILRSLFGLPFAKVSGYKNSPPTALFSLKYVSIYALGSKYLIIKIYS